MIPGSAGRIRPWPQGGLGGQARTSLDQGLPRSTYYFDAYLRGQWPGI